jgi:hypothetical protein
MVGALLRVGLCPVKPGTYSRHTRRERQQAKFIENMSLGLLPSLTAQFCQVTDQPFGIPFIPSTVRLAGQASNSIPGETSIYQCTSKLE